MWTTRSRAWEREFVAECEAFLSGHYAQCLADENRPVPVWAWLNVLAHGSEDDLTALAASDPPARGSQGASAWRGALGFLAQELMSQATRRGCSLGDLQRSTLVPLELDFAGGRGRGSASTSGEPSKLVSSVLSALARHPTTRHR